MSEQFNFKTICDNILRERKDSSLTSKSLWDDYLSHGTGNNVVAGEHEDRDVLELLQNARDAIVCGENAQRNGQILIAVTDQGMVIANMGAPFSLDDEKVFQAVTLLGESSKTENKQMIGHKGIGMKSILQRFGKFSIHTHLKSGELTTEFSRARSYAELEPEIKESAIREYVWSHLPKLPLFRTPHHTASNGDELLDSVRQGLKNVVPGLGRFDIDAYTTSLSLYYKDAEWENYLSNIEALLSENVKQGFLQSKKSYQVADVEGKSQDTLWELLTNPEKLDPRTFILLGHISQIQMVYFRSDAAGSLQPSEIRTYCIDGNSISPEPSSTTVELKEILWKKYGQRSEAQRVFLVLSKEGWTNQIIGYAFS